MRLKPSAPLRSVLALSVLLGSPGTAAAQYVGAASESVAGAASIAGAAPSVVSGSAHLGGIGASLAPALSSPMLPLSVEAAASVEAARGAVGVAPSVDSAPDSAGLIDGDSSASVLHVSPPAASAAGPSREADRALPSDLPGAGGETTRRRNAAIAGRALETSAALASGTPAPQVSPADESALLISGVQRRARAAMLRDEGPEVRPHLMAYAAAFKPNPRNLAAAFQVLSEPDATAPRALMEMLNALYVALNDAYFADLPRDIRLEISQKLHDSTARFLERVAQNSRLPQETRRLAEATRESYFQQDGLLAGFAWVRGEQLRLAAARRKLSEHDPAPPSETPSRAMPADVEELPWSVPKTVKPPSKNAQPSLLDFTVDFKELSRAFRERVVKFDLAVSRWEIARRLGGSEEFLSSARNLWEQERRSFSEALRRHQKDVGYFQRGTLQVNFYGGPIRFLWLPEHPGLSVQTLDNGYRLTASFETRINRPDVLRAVQRSIESRWKGDFEEGGKVKKFETRVRFRVLKAGEAYSGNALKLVDGQSEGNPVSNAYKDGISLGRQFRFGTPAHEFGHVLGLADEYGDEYSPESMRALRQADESSLMASNNGRVLPRHFNQLVAFLRLVGKTN